MKIMLLFILLFSVPSFAKPYLIEEHLKFLASQKKKNHWSLKNMFDGGSKNKAPLVSMAPSNIKKNQKFEFSLGLEYGNLNLDIDGNKSRFEVYRGSFSAYVRFIGIIGNFYLTENSKENHGDLNLSLRLIGTSQQTTHLSVFAGVKKTKELDSSGDKVNINNYLWGAEAMLYLIDIIGVSYHFTHMEANSETDIALRRTGRKHEIRVFLDYEYFRVFGLHRLERLEYTNTINLADKEIQGIMGGIQLFF